MEAIEVVYEFVGLFDTRKAVRPISPLADFDGDLTETVSGIRSSDDYGHALYNRWQVRDIKLPSWLSFRDWKQNEPAYQRILFDASETLAENETLIRYLVTLDRRARTAIRKLMTSNLRSSFRISLRSQVQSWLDSPQERHYDSPLSPRQWEAITRYIR